MDETRRNKRDTIAFWWAMFFWGNFYALIYIEIAAKIDVGYEYMTISALCGAICLSWYIPSFNKLINKYTNTHPQQEQKNEK